jgi:hypothetical protein
MAIFLPNDSNLKVGVAPSRLFAPDQTAALFSSA